MKREWESMFEVRQVDDPSEGDHWVWQVFRRGEDTRFNDRNYSQEIDAKRGAAQIYRFIMESLEKNLLEQ
jgi:hypothetical protein